MSEIVEKKIGDQKRKPLFSLRHLARHLRLNSEDSNIVLVNTMMDHGYSPNALIENGPEMALAWADVNLDRLLSEVAIFRQMGRNDYMDRRFASRLGSVNAIPVIQK